MTDWAAKVLEGVPRHNAQDAKNMTGYANAVWLHEDAVVDAIARMGAGDDDALIARLSNMGIQCCDLAADRIAALTAERRTLRLIIEANIEKHRSRAETAEAEAAALRVKVARLEGALQRIADEYSVKWQAGQWSRAALTDGGKDA